MILGCTTSAPPTDAPLVLPDRATPRSCFTTEEPPVLLSDTRCFEDLLLATPAPDLVPYRVASSLWTDGAEKERYLVLPPGEVITIEADAWQFPVGSVLIKTFSFRHRGRRELLEVRFLRRVPEGWEFFNYALEDGEGHLLETHQRRTIEPDGAPEPFDYYFPDRIGCWSCHGDDRPVLGPRSETMDRLVLYDDGERNQLEALATAGYLEGEALATPVVDPDDEAAPIELRARAWLHANCAHCHRPGGYAPSEIGMDLRYETPLEDTGTCGVPIAFGSIFAFDRIEPAHPEASGLLDRINAEGIRRMPPGTAYADPEGVALLSEWIAALRSCPE